ncbi:hypothetical protein ACOCJ7_05515 [Knoellia sp. CPCC 206453]|uniref:hypothetical protein n=1 Tax=Knoellia pratensis TaxID=3404796 RepID=UPI0036137203
MSITTPPDVVEPRTTPPSSPPGRPSRWWIAGVPVAIVTMLAATGYRVPVFWYQSGLHHEIASAEPEQWAQVNEPFTDARGDTTRDYSVRFAGLGSAGPAYEDRIGDEVTLADGMVAQVVTLDFRAAPEQPLKGCALTLIDDQGREFRVGHSFDAIGPNVTNCVPEETPGPSQPILAHQQRGVLPKGEQPRPREWSTSPAIAVPRDARFVELRISFEEPDYVTLKLAR